MAELFHFESLLKNTKEAFLLLDNQRFINDFYLAGGTALALHLGHRISGDLDFFTEKLFDESLLVQKLSIIGNFQLEKKSEQSVIGVLNGVKISFLGYGYPLLSPLKNISKTNIASIIDIACMKIDAISSRGAKRDFIDLFFAIKGGLSFEEILKAFEQKYSSINYNMMHIKKSLVYFDDAESDPMPQMLKPVSWEEIKLFFQKKITL